MTEKFPKKIFVTGTDTGVGKTVISAILVSGLNASYWKPVQSGLSQETDTEFIARHCETSGTIFPETYRLNEPISPHASSAKQGVNITLDSIVKPPLCKGPLIIEGAGGIMVPLNVKEYVVDLIEQLNMPVLIVSKNRLGTINHTLLTINTLRARGCTIWGVVMNGPPNKVNREAIEKYGNVNIVAEITSLKEMNHDSFVQAFEKFNLKTM